MFLLHMLPSSLLTLLLLSRTDITIYGALAHVHRSGTCARAFCTIGLNSNQKCHDRGSSLLNGREKPHCFFIVFNLKPSETDLVILLQFALKRLDAKRHRIHCVHPHDFSNTMKILKTYRTLILF